jgi:hypothetical protein
MKTAFLFRILFCGAVLQTLKSCKLDGVLDTKKQQHMQSWLEHSSLIDYIIAETSPI